MKKYDIYLNQGQPGSAVLCISTLRKALPDIYTGHAVGNDCTTYVS